jgi:phenylalanine-4-hydroxylase
LTSRFTVEFGVCKENDGVKAYGAGLLSSFGELEYSLSKKPQFEPFNLEKMATQPYPITSYQPIYFVAESFKHMKDAVKVYAAGFQRSFVTIYNPLTETIEGFCHIKLST